MSIHRARLLSGESVNDRDRIDAIVEFWNSLRVSDDHGSTTWEVLDELERRVTDCLALRPRDITTADRLTTEALFRMTGQWGN